MMALVWMGLAFAAEPEPTTAPTCPAFVDALDEVDTKLAALDVAGATDALAVGEQALIACDAVFSANQLGALWLREGVVESLQGNEAESNDAFAAAGRVAPDLWNANYGGALRAKYDLARVRTLPPAKLRLQPPPGGNAVRVDSQEVDGTLEVLELTAGLHGVEVLDPAGTVQFSKILWLAPDETSTIQTGVAPAPLPEPDVKTVPVVQPPSRKRVSPLLVGGIASVVAGSALLAVSVERSAAMDDATTAEALKSTYDLHVGTRIGGLGLVGLGVVGLGASFAF